MTLFWGLIVGLFITAVFLLGLELLNRYERDEEGHLDEADVEEHARPHGSVSVLPRRGEE
jgi:hypothetical protein